VRGCQKQKEFFEAESVRHGSTNFFVVWKSSGGNFPRVIIRTRWHRAVKCRDGNCREDGARAGKTANHEGHEGSRRKSLLPSFVRRFAEVVRLQFLLRAEACRQDGERKA
jgi:hypothetical protein